MIIKMCHQYAYSPVLVDECFPVLESQDPMEFRWQWPTESCPEDPLLPPFGHVVEKPGKITSDDSDDELNPVIPEPVPKVYTAVDSHHGHQSHVTTHH